MASITNFYFAGLPPIKARYPDNAAKRTFGKNAEVKEVADGLYEISEDHPYYGRSLLGYMVKE